MYHFVRRLGVNMHHLLNDEGMYIYIYMMRECSSEVIQLENRIQILSFI